MFKLKKINYLYKKNFYIFNINNCFSENFYEDLKSGLPNAENAKYAFENGKFTISSRTEQWKKILLNHPALNDFVNYFMTKKNLYYLYFSLLPKLIYSRRNRLLDVIKLIRIPRFHIEEFKKNRFFNDISVGFQISYISNLGKIVPHTDNVSKLLSLMIYFPEKIINEVDFGTTFYESNVENFNNKHLESDQDEIFFKNNTKVVYKAPFIENVMYGFIKNRYSWHSVDQIRAGKNYFRKSININFNLI